MGSEIFHVSQEPYLQQTCHLLIVVIYPFSPSGVESFTISLILLSNEELNSAASFFRDSFIRSQVLAQ